MVLEMLVKASLQNGRSMVGCGYGRWHEAADGRKPKKFTVPGCPRTEAFVIILHWRYEADVDKRRLDFLVRHEAMRQAKRFDGLPARIDRFVGVNFFADKGLTRDHPWVDYWVR